MEIVVQKEFAQKLLTLELSCQNCLVFQQNEPKTIESIDKKQKQYKATYAQLVAERKSFTTKLDQVKESLMAFEKRAAIDTNQQYKDLEQIKYNLRLIEDERVSASKYYIDQNERRNDSLTYLYAESIKQQYTTALTAGSYDLPSVIDNLKSLPISPIEPYEAKYLQQKDLQYIEARYVKLRPLDFDQMLNGIFDCFEQDLQTLNQEGQIQIEILPEPYDLFLQTPKIDGKQMMRCVEIELPNIDWFQYKKIMTFFLENPHLIESYKGASLDNLCAKQIVSYLNKYFTESGENPPMNFTISIK